MKILLIAGHGEGDPGACGNGYKESELTRELVGILKDKFSAGDVEVDVYDTTKNCFKQCKAGNVPDVKGYKYVLEVHFNSSTTTDTTGDGKMKGSMFFVHPEEKGVTVEQKILDNLYALGSCKAWDGIVVSTRNYDGGLLVQNRVKAQGVSHGLLETCFISDKDDMSWYQSNKDKIAKAIADGIIDGFGVRKSTSASTDTSSDSATKYYRVQIGAYTNKSNAEAMLAKVKDAGFDAIIKYD